ncbi:ABC transporter ATP-binding protein [uncultured Prochlorococcus sp.]|uniref:ABC transporter ATP-binding protein n=1 Tax=uncultured Prochlorococcus sp. TaxID=159733 RepID=UPI00258BBBC7|nr:ABC transporter ATP-binding protein [uncultured Prochlorococcus sp.]
MYSKTINLFLRLLKILSKERKTSFYKIIPFAIITGLVDVILVGLVSRLFVIVVQKENRPSIPFSEFISTDPFTKLIIIVFIYIILNWVASFLKLFLRAFREKLKAEIFIDFSQNIQKKLFNQKYEFFLSDKSEGISSKILLNISRVSEKFIGPILEIISGFFIIIFIFLAIFSFAKFNALILTISLVIGYTLISLSVTPYIRSATRQKIILENEINKIIKESMKTIIDVHLTGSEKYFENRYSQVSKKALPYLWKSETFPEFPRSLVEPFGITLIFAIGLFPYLQDRDPETLLEIIPFLATIAVASLKLTPPLQDFFRGITALRGGIPDLEEALKILELPNSRKYSAIKKNRKFIIPRNNIQIYNLSYKYPTKNEYALKNINLTIEAGSKIAVVGKTGSGKSTLANQIIGLLRPSEGKILVDGEELTNRNVTSWQSICAYVPQSINLLNADIRTNVAYGLNENDIDNSKVWEAIVTAQLEELISSLPKGLYTQLGENGVRISGGQRQRIAIARAFYRDSALLVLDEATSGLDSITESELMKSLLKVNKHITIIFIAHRLSTIKECDYIYEFKKGEIISSGKYQDLLNNSKSFKEMLLANKLNENLF